MVQAVPCFANLSDVVQVLWSIRCHPVAGVWWCQYHWLCSLPPPPFLASIYCILLLASLRYRTDLCIYEKYSLTSEKALKFIPSLPHTSYSPYLGLGPPYSSFGMWNGLLPYLTALFQFFHSPFLLVRKTKLFLLKHIMKSSICLLN